MRAAVCRANGSMAEVEVTDLPDLVPGHGEVRVRVGAASVNFPDVLQIQGLYQIRVPTPFTPGSEFGGTVDAVGDGVDPGLVGRRVMGADLVGAFAEQIVVPIASVSETPAGLDDIAASAFRVAYGTAYQSLITIGDARPGDTVVVLGAAGGVGLAAVQIASRMGMRVIAAASSDERLAVCIEHGAEVGINYATESLKDRIKELTDGGADVVIDPVGGDVSELALRATRWGGRFVVVGFASGTIPAIPLNLVLLKGVIVRGMEMRSIGHYLPESQELQTKALTELVADGMRPFVPAVYSLDDVAAALDHVGNRHAIGKVVIDLTR